MSLLNDAFTFLLPWIGLAPSFFIVYMSYRKRNKESTLLDRAKFKQLRKDINTIKKSRKGYHRRQVIEDIFSYMQTRSWDFEGHTEFGTNQSQYYWSAPTFREGKYMRVTIAWNTKYAMIDYITTRVEKDRKVEPGITEYSNPNKANKVEVNPRDLFPDITDDGKGPQGALSG